MNTTVKLLVTALSLCSVPAAFAMSPEQAAANLAGAKQFSHLADKVYSSALYNERATSLALSNTAFKYGDSSVETQRAALAHDAALAQVARARQDARIGRVQVDAALRAFRDGSIAPVATPTPTPTPALVAVPPKQPVATPGKIPQPMNVPPMLSQAVPPKAPQLPVQKTPQPMNVPPMLSQAVPPKAPALLSQAVPPKVPQLLAQKTPQPMNVPPVLSQAVPPKAPALLSQAVPPKTPQLPAQKTPQPMNVPPMLSQAVPPKAPALLSQAVPPKTPQLLAQKTPQPMNVPPVLSQAVPPKAPALLSQAVPPKGPQLPAQKTPQPMNVPPMLSQAVPPKVPQLPVQKTPQPMNVPPMLSQAVPPKVPQLPVQKTPQPLSTVYSGPTTQIVTKQSKSTLVAGLPKGTVINPQKPYAPGVTIIDNTPKTTASTFSVTKVDNGAQKPTTTASTSQKSGATYNVTTVNQVNSFYVTQQNSRQVTDNSQRIDHNSQQIANNSQRIDRNQKEIDDTRNDLKRGLNNAAAMSSLHYHSDNAWALSTGTANGDGAALAGGLQKGITSHVAVNMQASTSFDSGWMAGAGISGDF